MTDARPAHIAGGIWLLGAACLLCASCSLLPARAGGPAPARHPVPAHKGSPASPAQPAAPGLAAILPVSPARLQAAAALAGRFAAAYGTWSWRQPPAAWLAGLQPMTTSRLYAALTRAAGIPGVLVRCAATRQAATGTATAAKVRDLAPGSVTITVTLQQVITATSGTTQTHASLAVTLTPRGTGWAVWDLEPAAAGNS
jgi:hypothetical protein